MNRDTSKVEDREQDIVVIGAGAFGSCAAWEAASRGLSVVVVDRADFCAETSANHMKMVHGGIRYLQHADIYRVRESCRDRAILLRIAPHLVQPIPIVMPTYGHGMEGREVLRIGIHLYDLLTLDRNIGIHSGDNRIPNGRTVSRSECLKLFPMVDRKEVTGAGIFYDGQFYNPPRLALAFLASAVKAGASALNYVEVKGFLQKNGRVYGVRAEDKLTGQEFEIRSRMVLNATGPWAASLLDGAGIRLEPKPEFSRDLGFVISRRLSDRYVLACKLETKDPDALLSRKGRHIFMVPWRHYTLLGSWHVVHRKGPDEISVEWEELEGYIDEVNRVYPGLGLRTDDITLVYTGLTLFGENEEGATDLSFGKRSRLIDHRREDGLEGLITLIGVRATTARGMAEKAIDLAFRKIGKGFVKSRTDRTPIVGGDMHNFGEFLREAIAAADSVLEPKTVKSLVHNYGTEYVNVLKYTRSSSELGETIGQTETIKAQVVHAVREEMAVKLGDVLFRRTDIASGGWPGDAPVKICAEVMGAELGWDRARTQKEVETTRACFFSNGSKTWRKSIL